MSTLLVISVLSYFPRLYVCVHRFLFTHTVRVAVPKVAFDVISPLVVLDLFVQYRLTTWAFEYRGAPYSVAFCAGK